MRLSSNVVGNSDDESNFHHKLLLNNRQAANILKALANKLSKTLSFKMIQSGWILGRLLGALLKTRLP